MNFTNDTLPNITYAPTNDDSLGRIVYLPWTLLLLVLFCTMCYYSSRKPAPTTDTRIPRDRNGTYPYSNQIEQQASAAEIVVLPPGTTINPNGQKKKSKRNRSPDRLAYEQAQHEYAQL